MQIILLPDKSLRVRRIPVSLSYLPPLANAYVLFVLYMHNLERTMGQIQSGGYRKYVLNHAFIIAAVFPFVNRKVTEM